MPVWNTEGGGMGVMGAQPGPRPEPGSAGPIPTPRPGEAPRRKSPGRAASPAPSPCRAAPRHPGPARPALPDALTDFPRGGGPDSPEGAPGQHRPVLQHQSGHGVATCAPAIPRRRPSGERSAGLRRRREDPGRGRAATAPGAGQRHLGHRPRGCTGGYGHRGTRGDRARLPIHGGRPEMLEWASTGAGASLGGGPARTEMEHWEPPKMIPHGTGMVVR